MEVLKTIFWEANNGIIIGKSRILTSKPVLGLPAIGKLKKQDFNNLRLKKKEMKTDEYNEAKKLAA